MHGTLSRRYVLVARIFTKCLKICTNQWNRGRLLNYRILWQYWTCWFSYMRMRMLRFHGVKYMPKIINLTAICGFQVLHPLFCVPFCVQYTEFYKTEVPKLERIDHNHECEMIKMSTSWPKWVRIDWTIRTNWPNEYKLIISMRTKWPKWQRIDLSTSWL